MVESPSHSTTRPSVTDAELAARLEEQARIGGCPVCGLSNALVYEHMCALQYAIAIDDGARLGAMSEALCSSHLWYLFALTTPATVARFARPLIARLAATAHELAEALRRDADALRRGDAPLPEVAAARDCDVCTKLASWDAAIVRISACVLALETGATLGARLCAPHLGRVLRELPADAGSALVSAWEQAARRLAAQLEDFLRKSAARDRAMRGEQYAPKETLVRLAGAREGRRPLP